jgi:hypothetical protein
MAWVIWLWLSTCDYTWMWNVLAHVHDIAKMYEVIFINEWLRDLHLNLLLNIAIFLNFLHLDNHNINNSVKDRLGLYQNSSFIWIVSKERKKMFAVWGRTYSVVTSFRRPVSIDSPEAPPANPYPFGPKFLL